VTIGVICALPQEFDHLRGALDYTGSVNVAHARFDEGTLDGHGVVLATAGMGKINAASVATILADRFRCKSIVVSGVAGGLDPDLHIGDVVIAERITQHDAGLIKGGKLQVYQPGHVPFYNSTERLGYPIDAELLGRIKDRLDGFTLPPLSEAAGGRDQPPRIGFGTILTGDQFVHCEDTRERLHRELDGRAIEMEGGAVAQVCEAFGIPWVVIRTLSDLAGRDSSFDFGKFVREAADSSAVIFRRLLPIL
jgi:adenosylhomocysteine nucleosidase